MMTLKELRDLSRENNNLVNDKYKQCWEKIKLAAKAGDFNCEVEMWKDEHSSTDKTVRSLLKLEGLAVYQTGGSTIAGKAEYTIRWVSLI